MLLADTSVWHRSDHPTILDGWRRLLHRGDIAICPPIRLEVLYSARSADDYHQLSWELDGLIELPCEGRHFERALEVQSALADVGGLHHRSVKLVDLLVAAVAESAGASVWHYDEDYERIADITGQATRWAAPRGTL